MIVLGAQVEGRVVDVRIGDERIAEIGRLRPRPGETVVEARGGALLPGLHDHHIHVLSLAAAAGSVRCGPPEVTDLDGLAAALRAAPGEWVRGIGYHESVAGMLDRHLLDRLVPGRPVRIQHRGGALWMLNSRALAELRIPEHETGQFWRKDALIRERLGAQEPPDVAAAGRRLAALGITGVTDATPNLSGDAIALLTALPQRLHLLGAPTGAALPAGMTVGPHKILRPDHEPPDWDELHAEVSSAHAAGRAVAIHAVTRESLVLALAVLTDTGPLLGDRIEHAALAGEDLIPLLASTGAVVVTQPGFVTERAGQYRRDVPPREHADLYRYASLRRGGVRVVPSSDAPFASEDPWRTIAAAARRDLSPDERVPPGEALAGMLTPLADPGGSPRRIEVGAPADLCLLHVPLEEALSTMDAKMVAATVCRGRLYS
ncbi:MAG TPA: amidohydrolase family protein [Amycolatopsis sp.]|nr:amidohydrolase family protein [Amycolatopsis sp.]